MSCRIAHVVVELKVFVVVKGMFLHLRNLLDLLVKNKYIDSECAQ